MLVVPGNMGGVTEPCPQCEILIRAPFALTVAAPPSSSLQPEPEPEPEPVPNASPELSETAAWVSIEPREEEPRAVGDFDPPAPIQQSTPPARLLLPGIFLCIAVAITYGVKTFLLRDSGEDTQVKNTIVVDGSTKPAVNPVNPVNAVNAVQEPENKRSESLPNTVDIPTPPAVEPPQPLMPRIHDATQETQPKPLQKLLPVDGGIAALALLEEFLAMKTLQARMPYIETNRTEPELVSSILNDPLPEVLKISVDVRKTYSSEQIVDYYYHVDFAAANGGENPQTLLVRTRGTSPPKVVTDPFLDLFGGGLARYAEKPVGQAGTFQVIISAGAFCHDNIPASEEKYTLKILARDDTKEIAKAYFGKHSKIGEMLEGETSGLSYGQAQPGTVIMRWNTEEDPKRPFLEALDIKALNWNP